MICILLAPSTDNTDNKVLTYVLETLADPLKICWQPRFGSRPARLRNVGEPVDDGATKRYLVTQFLQSTTFCVVRR